MDTLNGLLGKRTARKVIEEEGESMKGQSEKDRKEKPKKAFKVLPYMKGIMERLHAQSL